MFVHQDGILLCPIIRALSELGVLERSLTAERTVAELFPEVRTQGFGYMRVGLRCLASQGWLSEGPALDPENTVLRWTEAGRSAMRYRDRYISAGRFLSQFTRSDPDFWTRRGDDAQVESFLELLEVACDRWRLDENLPTPLRASIATHLDAALVVPAMLWLRSAGMLADDGPKLPDDAAGRGVARLLAAVGWTDADGRAWTSTGREAATVAVHFGMAASYLPMLARLPDLYRGEAGVVPADGAPEWHVHRQLNVSASAAAHTRYFADADSIFLELFDREPIADQPRFIADIGCGDGSWLVHLYRLITERTLRGRRAAECPLLMVGLDYNEAALDRARRVVDSAGVPAVLIHGDISDPDGVAATLAEHGLQMEDGLHIRAFIDHDRTYLGADPDIPVCGWSTGAYVGRGGEPLDAADVERDLVAHLQRWTPHVRKHGLVVLEAHCVAPQIARKHLGATHSVAFDAYHGHSHQYPIEHPAFVDCCRLAGLRPESHCERRYPANRPFVAVSLNRLVVPTPAAELPALDPGAVREDTWQPDADVDLEDGRALHALLYTGTDLRYPRAWCSAATGFVVAGALEAVEGRIATATRGDVIRVLDYGAGTGLAAIELLKACNERGVEQRLERVGARLEVHLVDLPSSWFAQGFELLRGCAWTRFHSLRAEDGGFRPLAEVMGGLEVDAVMANMVFHLVPASALRRAAADIATVARDGGRVLWSSPDLGPPGPYAVLFHDANRALRARWLSLLQQERSRSEGASLMPGKGLPSPVCEAVRQARETMDDAALRRAEERAGRRVLPEANAATDVARALADHFAGAHRLERPTHELQRDDIVDTLLVPSNQAEYLPEVPDRALRESVIEALMLEQVIPELQEQPAGTSLGLNVQWTLGDVTKEAG